MEAGQKSWYGSWHLNPNHKPVHWGSFVALSLMVTGFLITQINLTYTFSDSVPQITKKAQAAGPNDYFYGLVARSDFWKGYSMRPQAGQPSTSVDYANQLLGPLQGGYRETNVTTVPGSNPIPVSYDPTNDTDPHKQDGTKFVIPAFGLVADTWTLAAAVSSTDTTLTIPGVTSTAEIGRQLKIDNEILTVTARDLTAKTLTVTRGQYGTFAAAHAQNAPVLVSEDSLDDNWTLRFPIFSDDGHKYLITWDGYWTDSYLNTGLINHKWTQLSSPSDTGTQSDTRSFLEVGARYDGGSSCCVPAGFNHSTDVGAIQIRSYDQLGGPADWTLSNGYQSGPSILTQDPVTPMTNSSFIIKPDVWTRFWILVDQRANDYDYVDMWVADENHPPVRVYTQLPMSIPPPASGSGVWNGIHKFWTEFNTSSYTFSRGSTRDLVAYERNLAILRDPTDVSSLLVQPVGSSGSGSGGTPDTTPPAVSLTSPANGATVSGNVVVSANASDNTAVSAVQFKLDGNNIGSQALFSPYAITWDSTTVSNGTHTLTAVATDTYGNTTTSSPITITTSNTAINPTPPPPPPPGTGQVIGRWSLDEGSGTTAADSSGNSFNGTLTNGPTWTTGHSGSAVSFDGVNDYINVPTNATLNSYPFSVSAWVKTTSTAQMGVVNKYVSSSYNGYNLYMNGGHIYAWYMKDINDYVWDGNAGLDGGIINDGNWHNVVFTVDSTGGKLYVDNVFKSSLPWKGTGSAPNTTQNLNFGNYASRYFSGSLDDIRIYNYALTTTDIANLYNSTSTTLAGDLNGDHIVNSIDWSILNSKWFTTDTTADLNHDGFVNAIDWSIMNQNWLKSN